MSIWVHTNQAEDVCGSIRQALRSAHFIAEDPQLWKWVALALHSALQGACVCHLTTTATPIGAVTPRNEAAWLSFFDALRTSPNAKPPRTHLMALPDLLKALRMPYSAGDRSNGTGVAIDDAELDWLCSFHNTVRNQFVHFEPKEWSLDVSGIPEIATLIARIIGEVLDMGWAFRHQDYPWREALSANLARLSSLDRNK